MANKDKLLESAQKFLAKGQLPKAIGEYQKLVQAFPKDYRNRQKLAELLGRERRNDEAQPHYEAVAKNFTETGFYLKAIAIYKQMQKIEPSRVDIYLRLAELNEKQGLIGNALNEYRSLIAFYDKNRMSRETVGVLQKMIALEPENLGVRGKLIETLAAVHETEDALEQFRSLVRLLSGKGEHAKVVKLYEKFLDLCPDDVDSRLPLAVALLASGQAEKSLALLKNLLKRAPDHPLLLSTLTDCHVAVGNHADARLTCQHLLKEQPQDLDLRERYVRICMAGADHERALECLEESKENFSQAGRVGVLKELYEALQSALPDNARLGATLAAIYEATGDAGTRPAFSSAGGGATAAEETADAAVLDAAIDDVEQLDLVGDIVAPAAASQPSGTSVSAVTPAVSKGGLELELDLDLDLDLSHDTPAPAMPVSTVQVPTAPAASPTPAAEPSEQPSDLASTPEIDTSLDMELELDLDGLVGVEVEPPAVEQIPPAEQTEPTTVLPEPETEDEQALLREQEVAAAEPGELVVEGLSLSDPGELELEMEPSLEAGVTVEEEISEQVPDEASGFELPDLEGLLSDLPETAEPFAEETLPVDVFVVDEPLPAEQADAMPTVETEFVIDNAIEEAGPHVDEINFAIPATEIPEVAEVQESLEVPEPVDETEEVAELDEVEEVEVLEDSEEFEEVEEVEELDEVEEFDDVESLEELEELDELDEVVEEPGPIAAEMLSVTPQQLRDGLEEAEFYLRQGLFDDAERVVRDLRRRDADLPELTAKLAEIEEQRQVAEGEEKGATFDLLSDIKDGELLGATDFLNDGSSVEADEFSLAETTEDDEDAQSHFDLGIAYKEMGLLDDAITEFGKAVRDPSRQLDCLTLKGQCQIEMGDIDKAETTYKEGLSLPNLTEEGMVALRYELGLLYEIAGRPLESLESFQLVADRDLFYRDVTDKLRLLRQQLGIDDQAIEAVSEGGNGRDRISFV